MARPPTPAPAPARVLGRLHYQFEDSGKRALGVGPEALARFVVGSSAPIAESRLLPLGSLQEKDTGSGCSLSQEAPLPVPRRPQGSALLPPHRPAAGLGRAPLRCPPGALVPKVRAFPTTAASWLHAVWFSCGENVYHTGRGTSAHTSLEEGHRSWGQGPGAGSAGGWFAQAALTPALSPRDQARPVSF